MGYHYHSEVWRHKRRGQCVTRTWMTESQVERVTWQELCNLQKTHVFRTGSLKSQPFSSPSLPSLVGAPCWLNPSAILKTKKLNDTELTSQFPRAESRVEKGTEWIMGGGGAHRQPLAPMPTNTRIYNAEFPRQHAQFKSESLLVHLSRSSPPLSLLIWPRASFPNNFSKH